MDFWRRTALVTPLIALCIVLIPWQGNGLKCYVCNSMHNESCAQLEGDQYLMDCNDVHDERGDGRNHTNCRKKVFTVVSDEFDMKSTRTIRSCGYEMHPRYPCFFSSNVDLKSATCECTEDGCNTATNLSSFPWLIHLFLVPLFFSIQSVT